MEEEEMVVWKKRKWWYGRRQTGANDFWFDLIDQWDQAEPTRQDLSMVFALGIFVCLPSPCTDMSRQLSRH